jgi:hypothetical protein
LLRSLTAGFGTKRQMLRRRNFGSDWRHSGPPAGARSLAAVTSPPLWGTARGEHVALIRESGATPIDYQHEDFTRVLPGGSMT